MAEEQHGQLQPGARDRPAVLMGLYGLWPLPVGVVLALMIHLLLAPLLPPLYAKILLDIGISIILAVSLNMVSGFTGQFSLGHAGFMAVGGYTAAAVTYYGGASALLWGSSALVPGLPSWTRSPADFVGVLVTPADALFLGACLAGGIVAALAGLLVGLPTLRLRGDYLAIVTLGFGEIVRVLLQQSKPLLMTVQEVEATPWPERFVHLGGALGFTRLTYFTSHFWVWFFVFMMLVVAVRLRYSTFGRSFLAIRENDIAAQAMGVPTTGYKVLAFVMGAFFAGIAGALFAHQVGTTLNPGEMGFLKSIDILIMVVLGGLGSISGSVLAAAVLTILPEALRSLSVGGVNLAEYRMVLYALLLILIMLLRPQGLLGTRELWDMKYWSRRKRL